MITSALGNLRHWRSRNFLIVMLAAIAGMLAGCGLSPDWPPTSAPAATVSRVVPTPTEFVLSAEGLYRHDLRHLGVTTAILASLPAGAILPPAPSGDSARGVSLLLDNRTTISGELYRQSGQPAPALMLLGADATAWGALPQQLSAAGFVVLVLQTDHLMPARQVDTMLQSLIAIQGVDAGAIGLIGESHSADLAMLGCAVNTLCDALALFSPTSRATLMNMLPSYGERPLWLAAGRSDSQSHRAALALSQGLRGQAQFIELDHGRGLDLLRAEPSLANQLVDWFVHHLRDS
ncbi:MAG: hypothetical protein OXG84_08065 [Chloroflexi bacterium]|nr:hypothetical protein [Chloroflexota bacterium]